MLHMHFIRNGREIQDNYVAKYMIVGTKGQ